MLNETSVVRLGVIGLLVACSCTLNDASEVQGRYQLKHIGDKQLRTRGESLRTCDLRPFHAWYVIGSGRWVSGDSTFVGCGSSPVDTLPRFQSDSGTYRSRGDTIEFFVSDSTIGVRGLVNRGITRGDSLLVGGGDMDGGDLLFLRVPD